MKKYLILSLLTALLMIVGCADGGGGSATTETPFIGGSNGLIMSFSPGQPPEEIYDNAQFEFSIVAQLENVGEDNIAEGEGYVKIHGLLAEDYGITQDDLKKNFEELRGANKNQDGSITTGQRTFVSFDNLNFQGSVPGPLDIGPIRAEACYDYASRASAQLCVRESFTTEKERELCEPSGEKPIANAGAPIHITKLLEEPQAGGKVQISFQIEHKGASTDRFYKAGTDCDDDLTNRDRYKVYIEVKPVSGIVPECQLENKEAPNIGYRTLWDGRAQTVTCTIDFGDVQTSFQPLIEVEARYRYSQYIETGLIVKDLPGDEEE